MNVPVSLEGLEPENLAPSHFTNTMEEMQLDGAQRFWLSQLAEILITSANIASVCGKTVVDLTDALNVEDAFFFMIGTYWLVAVEPNEGRCQLFRASYQREIPLEDFLNEKTPARIAFRRNDGSAQSGAHLNRKRGKRGGAQVKAREARHNSSSTGE